MANLKKALALVLAAATAFTFAPVSTLFNAVDAQAASGTNTKDLTTVANKIDSQNLSGWYLDDTENATVTTTGAGNGIWLKESHDQSGQVKAFAISVERYNTSKTGINYADLATVTTGAGNTITTSTTPADTEAYQVDIDNDLTASHKIWVVKNTTTSESNVSSNDADFVDGVRLGGTYINFLKSNLTKDRDNHDFHGYKVNVKIEALASYTQLDTVLKTATYTLTIGSNKASLVLDKTSDEVQESKSVDVSYTLRNKGTTSVIKAKADTGVAKADDSEIKSKSDNVSGSIKFYGLEAGTRVFTVAGYDAKGNQTTDPVTFTLTVNPKNSKLSVSYITEDGGARKTFTDDATMRDGNNVVKQDSLGEAGKTGDVTFTAEPETYTSNGKTYYTTVKDSKYKEQYDLDNKKLSTITAETTTAKELAADLVYGFKADKDVAGYNKDQMLPAAKLLTEDASGRKTVQISASYAAGQKVTYSIVAASNWHDADYGQTTSGQTTYSKDSNRTQVYAPNDEFSGKNFDGYAKYTSIGFASAVAPNATTDGTTRVSAGVAPGDSVTFTQAAATPYASVDQDGLVTIKNAVNAPNLYVVVYASKAQDNKIPASTYIIPIAIQSRAEVDFFATNTQQTADIDSAYARENYVDLTDNLKGLSTDTYKTFYLKKGESTKITPIGNVGASYITYSSDDESHATVVRNNDGSATVTAIKDTDPGKSVTITLKSSSSPEVEGLVNVTFKLVINELNVTAAPTSTGLTNGVTVGYGDPVKKIDTTIAGNTRSIVFDHEHVFEKVSTSERPSGYKALKVSDPHSTDFTVTSTGTVVYNKNNGSGLLYVRCRYAADDKNNPSQWTYVPVHYGESESNNTMNVTTDVINVEVGKSQAIAVSGAAIDSKITYTSADPTVATVDANGNVTGVKAGQTRIAVYASATDKLNDKTVYVPVVVYEKGQNPDQPQVIDKVTKPTKVTGLKVKNKKGGKVTVSWTKQNQQNIKYYVKKTVGKKSAGKSVGSNKTTLSVKKGATVKVKVKAYIYNASGKKLVGSYSKTVTLKTDKK